MGRQVVIIDGHAGVIRAVGDLLAHAGWGPIASATTIAEGSAVVEEVRPDLVIIDPAMVCGTGLALVELVRSRHNPPAVLVLTGHPSSELAAASVRAGARAVVPKETPAQDLLRAVDAVASGGGWMPDDLLGDTMAELVRPVPPTEWQLLLGTLTAREREVLDLLVAGFDRPSIGRQLDISLNTVRTHAKNILAKLGVHSSLEAVSVALRAGIRPPDPA